MKKSKIPNLLPSDVFLRAENTANHFCLLGKLSTDLDPLVGWSGGHPSTLPSHGCQRHFNLGTFGISLRAPYSDLQCNFLATLLNIQQWGRQRWWRWWWWLEHKTKHTTGCVPELHRLIHGSRSNQRRVPVKLGRANLSTMTNQCVHLPVNHTHSTA